MRMLCLVGAGQIFTPATLLLVDSDGGETTLASQLDNAEDARRLVACWNACEGIATEAIEVDGIGGVAATLAQNVRAMLELQSALERFVDLPRHQRHDAVANAIYVAGKYRPLIDAITKPKGAKS